MTPTAAAERLTAPERREQILEAAVTVFAERGYEGASTDVIARMAGISQPYLFRLFGTKRELIVATVQRCFEDTEELFSSAATGSRVRRRCTRSARRTSRRSAGARSSCARSCSRTPRATTPRFAPSSPRDSAGWCASSERLTGVELAQRRATFFAQGMLLNVLAMMGQIDEPQAWAMRLIEGCA